MANGQTLFSPGQLKEILEREQVDPANGSHVVIVTGDTNGIAATVAMTFHGGRSTWTVEGIGHVDLQGQFSGAGRVVVQW